MEISKTIYSNKDKDKTNSFILNNNFFKKFYKRNILNFTVFVEKNQNCVII